MTQQLSVTKRYGPLRRLSLVTVGVLCAAIAFAPLAPVVVVAADAATTARAAASGSTEQGDARATASAASATSVLDNGGQAAADTENPSATETAQDSAAEATAADAASAPAAETGDGAAAGAAETATADAATAATTENATEASTAPAADSASPATGVTPLTPALQPLATPPVKAGPLADVTNLTDDEVAALDDLNLLFEGGKPWTQVELLSDGSLNPAAYTTAVTGANTSLTAIANKTSWSNIPTQPADQIEMLYAPLFNATVNVKNASGTGTTQYTYADNTATGSHFFMIDSDTAESVIRDNQDGGVASVPYTKLDMSLGLGQTFAGLASQVNVYIDQAGHRLAKVMTMPDDWEIADIAAIDPVTGSISHRVYYKNLGATRTSIRLGTYLDSSLKKVVDEEGAKNEPRRYLSRLQLTADGYDGVYVTADVNLVDGYDKAIHEEGQSTSLQPGGLIVYSDPVDPTLTEVYGSRVSSQGTIGDVYGLVSATGQKMGTPVLGTSPDNLIDTSIVYMSKTIPSLPKGGTVHIEYIERLSDKMTATKRYVDKATGTVLAHEDIVGAPADKLVFTDRTTYMAQNPDVFTDYTLVVDNTDDAHNYTFQENPGGWTVTLRKLETYTPDNPGKLTLTTTAREFVEYLKDGEPYKPGELVKTITLYRYAKEREDESGKVYYEYSEWTEKKAVANAHNELKAPLNFEPLTNEQIQQYLPPDYIGTVTKLTIDSYDPITEDANAALSTATTPELADWLTTKEADLTITRTVNYTPAQVGPIVPKDPSDPYYAMTHKTLTVKVAIDDTALASADRKLVALGEDGTQAIKFVRTVTYSGDTLLELGPWTVDMEGVAPDKLADVFKNVTAKPLEGYNITPGDTVTAESPVTAVAGTVPATLVGQPISAALTAFAADDNGGVAGASALTKDGQGGTVTTELVYSMVMTYPAAGSRTTLWPAALAAAALALGATGLLIGARRRRLR